MGLYKIIETINSRNLFKYAVIIILSLVYFGTQNIKLNVLLAIFVALVYISYNYDELDTKKTQEEDIKELKREAIKPDPRNFEDKEDLVDLLFSIQDWYHYNPQAYEEMIDNLYAFFELYDSIKRGSKFCDQYYQIASSKKNNAINSLHSMIFTIPTHAEVMDKFNRAHKRMETIMNDYLNEIYDVCHRDLLKKGYDITRRAINTGPKAANHYFDKDYTYQIY